MACCITLKTWSPHSGPVKNVFLLFFFIFSPIPGLEYMPLFFFLSFAAQKEERE